MNKRDVVDWLLTYGWAIPVIIIAASGIVLTVNMAPETEQEIITITNGVIEYKGCYHGESLSQRRFDNCFSSYINNNGINFTPLFEMDGKRVNIPYPKECPKFDNVYAEYDWDSCTAYYDRNCDGDFEIEILNACGVGRTYMDWKKTDEPKERDIQKESYLLEKTPPREVYRLKSLSSSLVSKRGHIIDGLSCRANSCDSSNSGAVCLQCDYNVFSPKPESIVNEGYWKCAEHPFITKDVSHKCTPEQETVCITSYDVPDKSRCLSWVWTKDLSKSVNSDTGDQ